MGTFALIAAGCLALIWFANRVSATPKIEPTAPQVVVKLRELLYCDQTLEQLLASCSTHNQLLSEAVKALQNGQYKKAQSELESPQSQVLRNEILYWCALAKANELAGDKSGAAKAISELLKFDASRVRLNAWKLLRERGHLPELKEANRVLGVVVEVGFSNEPEQRTLVVAGYADGEARFFTLPTGPGVIGENLTPEVLAAAKALCASGQKMINGLPIESARPHPSAEHVRFYFLTPDGMHVSDELVSAVQSPVHPFHDAFFAMNDLMTQLRHIYEKAQH